MQSINVHAPNANKVLQKFLHWRKVYVCFIGFRLLPPARLYTMIHGKQKNTWRKLLSKKNPSFCTTVLEQEIDSLQIQALALFHSDCSN